MKMRKKLAALLAAAMIASVMPMTAFAASTNRVTKTVMVGKDKTTESNVPYLVVESKDDFEVDKAFYLTLDNAEFVTLGAILIADGKKMTEEEQEALKGQGTDAKEKLSDGTMIKVDGKVLAVYPQHATNTIRIPLAAKVTGAEATVTIDNGTTVTAGKYVFATSETSDAIAKVGDVKTFVDSGDVAKITIEESYAGAFNDAKKSQTVEVRLDNTDFSFTNAVGEEILVGKRGFDAKKYKVVKEKKSPTAKDDEYNEQVIKFEIPANAFVDSDGKALARGVLEIEGLKVKANKKASTGDVVVDVIAPFMKTTTLTVAKYGDYSVKATTKEVEKFTAGSKKTVKFVIEQVGDVIIADRLTTFAFSEDIKVSEIKKAGKLDLKDIKKDKNEFEISNLKGGLDGTKVEFEVELNIPAKFTGDIMVKASGRSIGEAVEVKLAEVKAPVKVEVEAMKVVVGTSGNKGGKITITETDKAMLKRGKKLIIQLPKELRKDNVEFTKVEDLVIETTGGIKVGKAAWVTKSGIEIEVTRESTEAGSLTITGFEVKAHRTIVDGAYAVEVGGPAISENTDLADNDDKNGYKNIDAITAADFLLVGNVRGNSNVVFTIGSNKFTVNGKEVEMDATAKIVDGRTMVPLRFLSVALGIDPENIAFTSGIVTIFSPDGKIIQVKNGDKNITINGMTIPMVAAAKIEDGRTYVPVTEIANVFGVTGTWDAATQTATFK